MAIEKLVKSGDWKGEKHVPAIIAPEKFTAGEAIKVKVHVGEEIGHPNTLEHYIKWIKLFFIPEGGSVAVELGNYEFAAHGELENFAEPCAEVTVKLPKSGKLYAMSYCNIHGLWENELEVTAE